MICKVYTLNNLYNNTFGEKKIIKSYRLDFECLYKHKLPTMNSRHPNK